MEINKKDKDILLNSLKSILDSIQLSQDAYKKYWFQSLKELIYKTESHIVDLIELITGNVIEHQKEAFDKLITQKEIDESLKKGKKERDAFEVNINAAIPNPGIRYKE